MFSHLCASGERPTAEDDITGAKLDIDGVIGTAVVEKGADVNVGTPVTDVVYGTDGTSVVLVRGSEKDARHVRQTNDSDDMQWDKFHWINGQGKIRYRWADS